MKIHVLFVILTSFSSVVQEVAPTDDIVRNAGSNEQSCMSVEEVPLCANLGYVNTTFPNLRDHKTPEQANEELSHFLALIHTGCSNAIVHFLCSIYAPVCIQEFKYKYPPCKRLCEYVRDGCADTLSQLFGYSWPEHLECYDYNTVEENQLCYGPNDPSILNIPPIIKYPDPPRNFTATPLSPSTVKFTWEQPEGSTNVVFILTCAPQPYEFPLSTSDTLLKAGHFDPDTNYTCSMFTAHTANIQNSTTTVRFQTPKPGPPRKVAARHQSPHSVKLSWSHPDSELSKVQREKYLYVLTCHSQNDDFMMSSKGETTILDNLQASTEYTCQISLAPYLIENQTALIIFTTLDPLEIHFINDTPNVVNNTVGLEFRTNRPVGRTTCKISGHSDKEDCSNYSVTFRNIPAGTHSLRIVAENNNKDKLVMKIKIYVSGTDALCCAVNLINNRITYIMDNSVMIYFKSTNSATQFRCSLNRQPSFECFSPLFLRRLENGSHQVKIIPISISNRCEHSTPLVTQFIIT